MYELQDFVKNCIHKTKIKITIFSFCFVRFALLNIFSTYIIFKNAKKKKKINNKEWVGVSKLLTTSVHLNNNQHQLLYLINYK